MTYSEFKKQIILHLKANLKKATVAGGEAKTDKELGIYLGYAKHAREMLNLVHDLWVQPEICDSCGLPFSVNNDGEKSNLCSTCATEKLKPLKLLDNHL